MRRHSVCLQFEIEALKRTATGSLRQLWGIRTGGEERQRHPEGLTNNSAWQLSGGKSCTAFQKSETSGGATVVQVFWNLESRTARAQ